MVADTNITDLLAHLEVPPQPEGWEVFHRDQDGDLCFLLQTEVAEWDWYKMEGFLTSSPRAWYYRTRISNDGWALWEREAERLQAQRKALMQKEVVTDADIQAVYDLKIAIAHAKHQAALWRRMGENNENL